ncbi:DNA-binding transcriptional LysR family regulator [Neorhizobium galegae]|uniref:LysR family transcriptional regulator n=1 Tax=Neorhizobium galegae TaxID=399 RepID=UPI0027896E12|nr:LysR family transcriptional regulator [Neorhizobium galegae]MDQ0137703.1 DNA-binding transcriptional LysR family regulator [Neorhizobium galegae]
MSFDRRQLQCFVEVATLGSINKAATALNVSQSALSRRIQQLEYAVGVPLFRRTTTGVQLTEQGALFREHAAEFDWEFDRLKSLVRNTKRTDDPKEIRLGMVPSASNLLLNRLVTDFAAEVTDLSLTLAEASKETLLEDIARGVIDLAITSLPVNDPRLQTRGLWRDQLFLVAPLGRISGGLHTLSDLPFVFCSRNAAFRSILAAALRRLGIVPIRSSEVSPSPTAKRLVGDGACFSILPYAAIVTELQGQEFDVMPIPKCDVEVGLVWRRSNMEHGLQNSLLTVIEPIVARICAEHSNDYIRPAIHKP